MDQCREKQHMRTINGGEQDCYMGHVPGVTQYKMDEEGHVHEVSDKYRHELLGKGLHEQHVWSYFYLNLPQKQPASQTGKVNAVSGEHSDPRPTGAVLIKLHHK